MFILHLWTILISFYMDNFNHFNNLKKQEEYKAIEKILEISFAFLRV